MLFSQRKGFKPVKNTIQSDSVDTDLRCALWDAIHLCILKEYKNGSLIDCIEGSNLDLLFKRYWHLYFKRPVDSIPQSIHMGIESIRDYFFKCKWFEIYDFIEFTIKNCPEKLSKHFRDFCNETLEREKSGYRFVNFQLVDISSPKEIESIEEAIKKSSKFYGVQEHLKTSLVFLSDRKNPDYRNSIKESISAVESLVKVVTKDEKGTLGSALKVLRKNNDLHPAFEKSLSILYGYTSDADGIRHSLLEKSSLTYTDAKFMLVTCTAFMNYIIGKLSEN